MAWHDSMTQQDVTFHYRCTEWQEQTQAGSGMDRNNRQEAYLHNSYIFKLVKNHLVGALREPLVASLGLGDMQTKLVRNVLNGVSLVNVLSEHKLVTSSTTLTGSNDGRGKEELPDSEPSDTVLVDDLVLVAQPVSVPAPQSCRVVNTNVINGDGLETSTLHLVEEEREGSRSISTRENVLVHEQTPVEILVLPRLSETRVLENKGTIILKHIVDLRAERAKVLDTNVLNHLEGDDLVVLLAVSGEGDFSVVHAEDSGLGRGSAILGKVVVTVLGLVSAKSDTSNVAAVLRRGVSGKSTPSTSNIKNLLALLKGGLLANNSELVILELLEGLELVDVRNNTGSVDHSGTKEPSVEVITPVVVLSDLLLILGLGVENDLGNHGEEEKLEQRPGEVEGHEVMSVLEDLKSITSHRNLASKVELMESLVRDLVVARVLLGERGIVELEVVLNRSARELAVSVDSGRNGRDDSPESNKERDTGHEEEEEVSPHASSNLVVDEKGDTEENGEEGTVGEVSRSGTLGRQGCVLDTGVLG